MEKYSQRESLLLGYSPKISNGNPASSSPKALDRNSDIDFNDVFGGPPRRRSSIGETRYSFNEPAESFTPKEDDEPVVSRNLWAGLSEKPVFGEEPGYGRRHPGNGFFDDIFKGEEFCASTPKKHDREPFSPIFSRISSPIIPLPPMAETFGSPSPPARFSLPARVVRGLDFSAIDSAARSSNKCNNSVTDGVNPSYSLSRFSSLSSQVQEDIKHDIQSFYRTSLSSQELNHSRDEPSEGNNTEDSLEKSINGAEDSNDGNKFQFHFSIYKWANKEVPLTMPPTRMNFSRSKESTKTRKSSSSNGRTTSEKNGRESPTSTLPNFDHRSSNHIFMSTDSFKLRHEKEESDFAFEEKNQQKKEPSLPKTESEKSGNRRGSADPGLFPNLRSEAKFNSFIHEGLSEITEKKLPGYTTEAFKLESQTSFMSTDDDAKGGKTIAAKGIHIKDGGAETKAKSNRRLFGGAETKAKSNRRLSLTLDSDNILKKNNEGATVISKTKVDKSSSQASPANSGLIDGRQRVGKVKDFVKIFNQEHSSTSVGDFESPSQSSKQKKKGTSGTGVEVCDSTRIDEKLPQKNLNNTFANVKNVVSNVPIDVDELSNPPSTEQPADKTDSDRINTTFSGQNSPTLSSDSIPEDSNFTMVDTDQSFQEDFMITELSQDEIKLPQIQNDREEKRAIDAKIRHWSRGKEGNIRSLLSTLQYVLWPESGWKSVPLVDIIDGNAVKRSYQRALLCLHPDKLQQRGVTSQQKYAAEKVFDILQEAWTLFNSAGLL